MSIKIFCINLKQYIEVEEYSFAISIIEKYNIQLIHEPIGLIVDNIGKDLKYRIHRKCSIEFIDNTNPEGYRMYLRSLSFILYKAVYDLYPKSNLRIEHSTSNGIFCELQNIDDPCSVDKISKIKKRIIEIIDKNLPFEYELSENTDLIERFEKQGLPDKARLFRYQNTLYTKVYKLDGLLDAFYGALAINTGQIKVFDLQPYHKGMLLLTANNHRPQTLNTPIHQQKMFNVLSEFRAWNKISNISDIQDINAHIENDGGSLLIKISEALHERKIAEIAKSIFEEHNVIKIILISGPSSSGKTSFSKRLAIQLRVNGLEPINISMDDYFLEREKSPKNEKGEYNFEDIESVDINQFSQDLKELIEGKEIQIPQFNFILGKREYNDNFLKLTDKSVIIIEGIHALNPNILNNISDSSILRIYVSALILTSLDSHNRIATSDLRLIRRLVRDSKTRGADGTRTLKMWQNVRNGEEKNIFPYQENADIMFNSVLIYELAALKPYVIPVLEKVKASESTYLEAQRIIKLMKFVLPMEHKEIPPTSILREFIGDSSFVY